MRKVFWVLLALTLLVALAASVSLAAEGVTHYRDTIQRTIFSCNGEAVQIDGDRHWIIYGHMDSSGGEHYFIQVNEKGTGLGLTSGLKYQFNEHGRLFVFNTNGRQWEETWEYTWTLVAPGPDNNLVVHSTDHVTQNANGEIVVNHYTTHTECH